MFISAEDAATIPAIAIGQSCPRSASWPTALRQPASDRRSWLHRACNFRRQCRIFLFGAAPHHSALLTTARERCVPAMFGVGVAPAHEEPRSGLNNSAHESTSGRSTNYGSGHLIRVFRDIGRIFSLLFLLSHPSPVGHPPRRRVQSQSGNLLHPLADAGDEIEQTRLVPVDAVGADDIVEEP